MGRVKLLTASERLSSIIKVLQIMRSRALVNL